MISKDDTDFPLSFETVKYKVLNDVSFDILKNIFTLEELKSILLDTNLRKVKNPQTKESIKNVIKG